MVEEAELRRAIEALLPHVDIEATQAELRRLLADPRFHGHRPEEFRVVLARWGAGPSNLEGITSGYREWCNYAKQSECLARTLTDSDVYEIAFDFAIGAEWGGFVKEVKSTIDPGTIRTVLLTSMVIFMASIAFPELTTKIPAAAATVILTAYIGARAVYDLIFGWIRMVGELDAATSFDQVRAAGVRYGEKIGTQTARILILLATAAIAEGGLIARLMKLPRASEASVALATETGGVGLEVASQVKGVRVSAGGVAIAIEGPVKGAVGFAMASRGPRPGSHQSTRPGSPASSTSALVAKVQGQLWRYPKVIDPRTGRPIPFPTGNLKPVPVQQRVPWGNAQRGEFIREWHERGYATPKGGWDNYDIHHIQPRELGGDNDFWNLVPVERGTHQAEFNSFWQELME